MKVQEKWLVDAKTPPCFLVHAFDDLDVPVDNSFLMLQALRGAGRPVKVHLFEQGGHGFGVGPAGLRCARWPQLFDDWVRFR